MTTYDADTVMGMLNMSSAAVPKMVIQLKEEDAAWNPTSTHSMLSGPAIVTYTMWPDGGVDVAVGDL